MTTETAFKFVAASRRASVCGLVDANCKLWCADLQSRALIGVFSIVFDIGGERVAIDDEGTLCISAAYHKHGVAAYAIPGGQVIWRRPDIKKVQKVVWDHLHGRCILVRDAASAEVVEPSDGRTIERIPRVSNWFPSPYESVCLCEERQLKVLELPSRRCRFAKESQACGVLSACFSPDTVFVAESDGPLQAFSLAGGELRWSLKHPKQHYLSLAFCELRSQLYGIRWEFVTGTEIALDRISPDTGAISSSVSLSPGAVTGTFAEKGSFYVGSDLIVRETATDGVFTLPL